MPAVTPSRRRRLRALHRWLGISSAIFLLALCLSGLALNHAGGLALDQRFVDWDWLLGRYGIDGPARLESFAAGDYRVSLADNVLYIGAEPVAALRLDSLAGAVAVGEEIIVAGPGQLAYLNPAGEILEVASLSPQLTGELTGISYADSQLWLFGTDQVLVYDAVGGNLRPPAEAARLPEPVPASEPPPGLMTAIERDFRGRGVSTERLLLDLHSGRLFGVSGRLVLDAAALALIVLSLSGIQIWLRR